MEKLRAIDMDIVQHVIARGKMFEKREKLVAELRGTTELSDYHAELQEWFNSTKQEQPHD